MTEMKDSQKEWKAILEQESGSEDVPFLNF